MSISRRGHKPLPRHNSKYIIAITNRAPSTTHHGTQRKWKQLSTRTPREKSEGIEGEKTRKNSVNYVSDGKCFLNGRLIMASVICRPLTIKRK